MFRRQLARLRGPGKSAAKTRLRLKDVAFEDVAKNPEAFKASLVGGVADSLQIAEERLRWECGVKHRGLKSDVGF